MSDDHHDCPSCGGKLVSDPLKCERCSWHLVTRKEWKALPPFQQGFLLYMQGSWPTSPLAREKNPYPQDTSAWHAFVEGQQRATRAAQDGEE